MLARTLAVSMLLVGVAATLAGAVPPPPTLVLIEPNSGGPGCYLTYGTDPVALPAGIEWRNDADANHSHTVTQREGFWSFTVPGGQKFDRTIHSAGTYAEECDMSGNFAQAVHVAITAPSSTSASSFVLTWADSGAPSTYHYTVQFRVGTTGAWHSWRVRTTARSGTFNDSHGHTYYFRALTLNPANSKPCAWSPLKKVVVS